MGYVYMINMNNYCHSVTYGYELFIKYNFNVFYNVKEHIIIHRRKLIIYFQINLIDLFYRW
jgi:hypothetical protein